MFQEHATETRIKLAMGYYDPIAYGKVGARPDVSSL